jgi:tRNA U38,U39,U40 pseudouridine synthase TruA
MAKIAAVAAGDDYLLTVRLENGSTVTVDLKKKLFTARFSELRDRQVFAAARTDGKAVHWPGGLSLAVSELLEIAAK